MKVLTARKAQATQDGAGVKINRIAGFDGKSLDPFLMIDELKSDDSGDYMAGFPAHPHRGIETFTYIRKGGFEHRDQMGNVKAIRSGDVQWMSTGRGVVHSEMPLADAVDGMHGFQIWLNMPAKEKMRAPRYQDSAVTGVKTVETAQGVVLRALAGDWHIEGQTVSAHLQGLAGDGALADVVMPANSKTTLDLSEHGKALIYIHSGNLLDERFGQMIQLTLDPTEPVILESGAHGVGLLVLAGNPINERIAHMGPFVMNTQEELHQAIRDYQQGRFGDIV
ncbi:pirin family protein [Pseudoalteromonas xiamenensis]|uniref:Pirin family protein n=1 Tax=Pseudoalteromonas xiamenensis TaxID=882626 RepID=A0A975HMS7_9GAMM|nr:pirin family protein [Pseudoalteromonas xiamenensis]QTH73302.1 pirin family protein [Pseudoalteromonas xiamenensis]